MTLLMDPKSKAIMDQNVVDAEASGNVELAKELRRIQAELIHKLDQKEEQLREDGRLDGVLQLLSVLDRAKGDGHAGAAQEG